MQKRKPVKKKEAVERFALRIDYSPEFEDGMDLEYFSLYAAYVTVKGKERIKEEYYVPVYQFEDIERIFKERNR